MVDVEMKVAAMAQQVLDLVQVTEALRMEAMGQGGELAPVERLLLHLVALEEGAMRCVARKLSTWGYLSRNTSAPTD